jgi:hypothetical protein
MSNESGDAAAEDSVQTRSTQAELGLADLPRRGTSRSTVRPSAVGGILRQKAHDAACAGRRECSQGTYIHIQIGVCLAVCEVHCTG